MYHSTDERFKQSPSFSATLLDKIYRSIDQPESDMIKKQTSRMQNNRHDTDSDPLFFSSTSSSSDSSSVGFSSSDAASVTGVKPRTASTFLPPPPKPVRTTIPSRPEKCKRTDEKQRRASLPLFDNYSNSQRFEDIHDHGIIKSKSRAFKLYANLKKAKTPISPGGRLSSFINSLFTSGNLKKPNNSTSNHSFDDMSIDKSYHPSSASSLSRSCLSKKSPGRRTAQKRSVRFYPVTIILDEDLKPVGHKSLSDESGRVQRSGRRCVRNDFVVDYLRNQKKNKLMENYGVFDEEDASSCSSSDLFELDHLDVMGKDSRYRQELPVYETTHFRVR